MKEYIPVNHIKFLEQAAIKVVPLSYNLEKEELFDILSFVNGLYVCGDSKYSFENE